MRVWRLIKWACFLLWYGSCGCRGGGRVMAVLPTFAKEKSSQDTNPLLFEFPNKCVSLEINVGDFLVSKAMDNVHACSVYCCHGFQPHIRFAGIFFHRNIVLSHWSLCCINRLEHERPGRRSGQQNHRERKIWGSRWWRETGRRGNFKYTLVWRGKKRLRVWFRRESTFGKILRLIIFKWNNICTDVFSLNYFSSIIIVPKKKWQQKFRDSFLFR